jgi:hypothetical protein
MANDRRLGAEREQESASRRSQAKSASEPGAPATSVLPTIIGNRGFAALASLEAGALRLSLGNRVVGAAIARCASDRKTADEPELTEDEETDVVGDRRRISRQGAPSAPAGPAPAAPAAPAPPPAAVALPAHIRGSATPAAMANDRIPPRKGTTVHVGITGWTKSSPPIILSVDGGGGGNGSVTIDGKATRSLTSSRNVTLAGVEQTAPGNADNLVLTARKGGAVVATSSGFSVSSIPQNYKDVFHHKLTGAVRGFAVQDSWKSDSGAVADLDQTEISEQVEYTSSTGCFSGTGHSNSGYLPGDSFSQDSHSTPVAILTAVGQRIAQQTCEFKDKRTGATDIPMTRSGYTITRDVTAKAGGGFQIKTTKVGAATTANGIASAAGAGSITRTQDV